MAATSTAKKSSSKLAKMPIADYDRLSVKAIVPRLTELSDRELQAVVVHEKAGKNRVTLLQAVRKLELLREAGAARHAPATRELAVVEDLGTVEDLDPVDDLDWDEHRVVESLGTAADLDFDDDLDLHEDSLVDEHPEADDDPDLDEGFGLMDDFDRAMKALEDEAEEPVVTPVPAPPVSKRGRKSPQKSEAVPAVAAKTKSKAKAKAKAAPRSEAPAPEADKKPRAAMKAATWEEEVRPELPKRIAAAASAFELEYEPAPMSLVPPLAEPSTKATTAAPRFARVIKLQKKFQGAALVMAAILAVLLGLAIGTVLARTGSVSAQPTPASVSTQSAPVAPGG